jgi:hypothetical protein
MPTLMAVQDKGILSIVTTDWPEAGAVPEAPKGSENKIQSQSQNKDGQNLTVHGGLHIRTEHLTVNLHPPKGE